MGQALYRKYRSRSFEEVIGQDHITTTLSSAIKAEVVSHAYLFTGPRGVGKTSVARILAHEINDLDYSDDSIHLDIIEIDAASNRRIDEIRDLRDKVNISPVSAKYKVYIIDEVHMLTREAFNALLKTLEEPPKHCVFILATTEIYKVPDTIVSRTQKFTFKPVSEKEVAKHLTEIAAREGIKIDPKAIELLARHGEGSFRDSISLLDQISANQKEITESDVSDLMGLPSGTLVDELTMAITSGDIQKAHRALEQLKDSGSDAVIIAKSLGAKLRDEIISSEVSNTNLVLLKELLEVASSPDPQMLLEISILKAASKNMKVKEQPTINHNLKPKASTSPDINPKNNDYVPKSVSNIDNLESLDKWPEVLEGVRQKAVSLYSALRLSEPRIMGNQIEIVFQFPLHKNKICKAENLNIIEKIASDVFGFKVQIHCLVDKVNLVPSRKVPTESKSLNSVSTLNVLSSVFGSAEVLEN